MNTDKLMELANKWDESSGEGLNEAGRAALRICARQLRDELAAALRAEQAVGEEHIARKLLADTVGLTVEQLAMCATTSIPEAISAITRALGTARPNDLDAVVAQRDALAGKLAWLEESVRNAGCEIDYSATQGEGGEDCVWNRRAEDAETARQSEGMVLVPREPTAEMLEAAGTMRGYGDDSGEATSADADHIEWWKSMLAAAPGGEGEGKV